MMKRLLILTGLILTALMSPAVILGQHVKVGNIEFRQEDDDIVITYELELDEAIRKARDVTVWASFDGGETFLLLKEVSGDVGTVTGSGIKTVRWRIFDELGSEPVEGNLVFRIEGGYREPAKYRYMRIDPAMMLGVNIDIRSNSSFGTGYGVSVGYVRNWGAYIGYAYSSASDFDSNSYTAGIMKYISDNFYFYAGGGGFSSESITDKAELSRSGTRFKFETGLILRMRRFGLSAGYAYVAKENISSLSLGINLFF